MRTITCINYTLNINLIVAPCIFCRITSVYQPTNAHIISHKTLIKHFKTLRHVSILSDHYKGALFLAKFMFQCSQFNSYYTFPGSFYNTDSIIHRQSIRAFDANQAYLWRKLRGAAESSIY